MRFRHAALIVVVLSLGSGCRCGTPITPIDVGFDVQPQALEFDRQLEGDRVTKVVTLTPTSSSAITVDVSSDAPAFTVPAASFDVPRGGSVDVPVTFLAGMVEVNGTLTFSSGEKSIAVSVHGVGVRPPRCVTDPCSRSTYSLELDRCVVTPAPDETPCDPGNLCLEDGRCKAQQCLGVARSCDDNNACTVDGCSMTAGCVNLRRTCPAPANPCRMATCDPTTGCGETDAPIGTPCGSADCITANLCDQGVCKTISTPDGTPCGAELACLKSGTCQNHACVRPPITEWEPSWSAPLAGAPNAEGPEVIGESSLFLSLCGLPAAAGTTCGLASYTPGGLERFTTPFDDGAPHGLVHVSPRGVLLTRDGGLEYRSPATGAVVESLDASVMTSAVAYAPDGAVLLVVGDKVTAWTDAGTSALTAAPGATLLALDRQGALYAYDADAGVLLAVTWLDDGGVLAQTVGVVGDASLTVSSGGVVVGGTSVIATDGGLASTALVGSVALLPRGVLESDTQAFRFGTACTPPLVTCSADQQTLWVTVNALASGARDWSFGSPVPATRLFEPTLFNARFVGSPPEDMSVGTLVDLPLDGGHRTSLIVVAPSAVVGRGEALLACDLPPASADVRWALFRNQAMITVATRGDGGYVLESFDLHQLPLLGRAWSAPEGVGGWRRAR